jgi:hypothetical protein
MSDIAIGETHKSRAVNQGSGNPLLHFTVSLKPATLAITVEDDWKGFPSRIKAGTDRNKKGRLRIGLRRLSRSGRNRLPRQFIKVADHVAFSTFQKKCSRQKGKEGVVFVGAFAIKTDEQV